MILITRTVNELGRIVLPQEMRQRAGIECNTTIDISQDDAGTIHIAHTSPRCTLCGNKECLHQLDVGHICEKCAEKIRAIS